MLEEKINLVWQRIMTLMQMQLLKELMEYSNRIFLEDDQVDLQTMKLLVKDAIENYKTKRPYWSCHIKTPEQMYAQSQVKLEHIKTKIVASSKYLIN